MEFDHYLTKNQLNYHNYLFKTQEIDIIFIIYYLKYLLLLISVFLLKILKGEFPQLNYNSILKKNNKITKKFRNHEKIKYLIIFKFPQLSTK